MTALLPPPASLAPHSIGAYAALIVIGFVIGIVGHLTRIRWLLLAGIALICIGALAFPFATGLTTQSRPPSLDAPAGE